MKWQDKEMLLKWPGLLHVWLVMREDRFSLPESMIDGSGR